MSGQKLVSFEVYYLQDGRWQIHARYGRGEREESVEEARRLDTGGFSAACVVRESYEKSTNKSEEAVIYYTPTLKTRPPVSQITSGSGPDGAWPGGKPPEGSAAANAARDAQQREEAFEQKQKVEAEERERKIAAQKAAAAVQMPDPPVVVEEAIGETILKVIMVCVLSLIPAGGLTYTSFHIISWAREQGIQIGVQQAQIALIAIFILSFAAFFVPLLRRYVTFGTKVIEPDQTVEKPKKSVIDTMMPVRDEYGLNGDFDEDELIPSEEIDRVDAAETDEEVSFEDEDDDEQAELEEDDAVEESDKTIGSTGFYEADPELTAEEAEVAGELAITPVDGTGDPEDMDNELERMGEEARKTVGANMDDYTKFGLTLFFAGAGEALSRKFRIIGKAALNIMVKHVVALGNSDRIARGFIANIEEYLLDDRYFGMYRRGRSAAYRRIIDPKAPLGLDAALAEWRNPTKSKDDEEADGDEPDDEKPKEADDGEKFVAVFFTDIVDSTAKQQKNGDRWMMDVIRAHNEIVREGLKKYAGREIKHTGDGIMATFPSAQNAVEASILMQRGFKQFANVMPDRGFEVRVGISAGEPIHEGGDIFGTPVNLAARVLSKTDANQICVSSIVKDLCQGKGYKFNQHGTFELKGFPEAQIIYNVGYTVPDSAPLVPDAMAAGGDSDRPPGNPASGRSPQVAA